MGPIRTGRTAGRTHGQHGTAPHGPKRSESAGAEPAPSRPGTAPHGTHGTAPQGLHGAARDRTGSHRTGLTGTHSRGRTGPHHTGRTGPLLYKHITSYKNITIKITVITQNITRLNIKTKKTNRRAVLRCGALLRAVFSLERRGQ